MLERRVSRGVTFLVAKAMESAGFLVAFTERSGGTSTGPYRSLNLGLRDADESQRVLENRRRACRALDVPSFACAQQVHGTHRVRIGPKRAGAGYTDRDEAVPGTDCLVTASRGVAVAVMTADCVPIALGDPVKGTIAVVHAGWRGIARGVLASALGAFPEPSRLKAAIGPAVGPDHYEVREDVALAVGMAAEGGAVTERHGSRINLDLPGTVARVLRERGVRSIERAGECTACERARFFSYRRDGETGRQALVAVRL
jgi:YfiH family protein